jgi:hypothetical protein
MDHEMKVMCLPLKIRGNAFCGYNIIMGSHTISLIGYRCDTIAFLLQGFYGFPDSTPGNRELFCQLGATDADASVFLQYS